MTCEWIEGNLSAYLDDALDPRAREDVGTHVASCAHCQALLDDYRRDERLLRALPTVQPDDQLRERIFASPEYIALTRSAANPTHPSRLWRVLLPVAAVVALAVSGGLYARTQMLSSPGAHTSPSHTIGDPNSFTYPLAPGQRVLFLRDGALWSAPETPASGAATASAPQRLTPASARVVAWSVAPARAAQGGQLVAWIDSAGALHLVRADGLADRVMAQVAPDSQTLPATVLDSLVWSPNGARLAFISMDASGALTLRTLTVGGLNTTNNGQVSAPVAVNGLASVPVWSANSEALAWVTSGGATQSVWTLRSGAMTQITTQSDPQDSQAAITQLAWSGASVTWATRHGDQISGVFAAVPGAARVTRLTPVGARYGAAVFGPGGWLLAGQSALWRIAPRASAPTQVATLSGQVSAIVWAPNGKLAAILTVNGAAQGARLSLWSASDGLTLVSSGAANASPPAWSADSQWLAWVDSGQAVIARVQRGVTAGRVSAGAVSAPASLAWSADGATVAISDARGVYIASADGSGFTLITSHAPSAPTLVWSTAG
jgi:hypothetical protein